MVELDTWINVNEKSRCYEFPTKWFTFYNVTRIKVSSHGNIYLEFDDCEYGFDETDTVLSTTSTHAIVTPHEHTVCFLDIDKWSF